MAELLAVEGLTAGYGEAIVIEDIAFTLAEGGSLALLGRNGAGKSTLVRALMGLTRRHCGEVRLKGETITGLAPFDRVARGIAWVPQERYMFPSLTVNEHLSAVARPGPWTAERIYALFPSLATRRANLGNQLSGGEQQMLAIGRALMVNPSLLLLDEPMEGLAPIVVQGLAQVIRELAADGGMGLILVEPHARLALEIAGEALVLERGRIAHRSASRNLLEDPDLLGRLLAVA